MFLLKTHIPEYDCPLTYGNGNGTSTLNEILQHNGCKHAEIVDIEYNKTRYLSPE